MQQIRVELGKTSYPIYILLRSIGKATVVENVTDDQIRQAIMEVGT